MVKEKRRGQPERRKVAEHRKWHGTGKIKAQDLELQAPASGSTLQGRLVGAVGLLQCGCSSLVPGRRVCGRGQEEGRSLPFGYSR